MNGQKALKQIALIKTGCTIEQIKPRHGDFEDWFAHGLGVADLLQIDVFRQQPLPPPETLAGIVVTGSPAMVSDRLDWSERTAQWLQQAVKKDIPVLGVCYGHQLLAHALGGRAGPNPAGRQIGTVSAQIIDNVEDDPLLGHLPNRFSAQSSHSEVVLELPTDATRLATSPLDDNFAIRFAKNAWGIQFHPEFSAPVTMDYIRYRADDLREEGLNPQELLDRTRDTKEAKSVLPKFAELVRNHD
ncbi:MAG: glutamine amidotransferase [Xanthomonadales bacterium]|nr:glutamine amidotransferase [Xanthomonadales bacterium]